MSNTVAISVATQANVQSSIAAAQAREAKRIACQLNVETYHSNTATVQQMKQYSDCVDFLYPSPMSPEAVIVAKIAFVIALIGMAIGFWKAKKDPYGSEFSDYVLYGFMGFIFLPLGIGFVAFVLGGIACLFT